MHRCMRLIAAALTAVLAIPLWSAAASARPLLDAGATAVAPTSGMFTVGGTDMADFAQRTYTVAGGDIMSYTLTAGELTFDVRSAISSTDTYKLHFQLPAGQELAVGTYYADQRYYSGDGKPAFYLSHYSSGCESGGRAEVFVHRLVKNGAGTITGIDLSFVQHCSPFILAFARGRLQLDLPLESVVADAAAALGIKGGIDYWNVNESRIMLTPGHTVRAQSEMAGRAVYIGAFDSEYFSMAVAAPAGQIIELGKTYPASSQSHGMPGESAFIQAGSYRFSYCDTENGTFVVNDLHALADGRIDRLDLTFQRVCVQSGQQYALAGRVLVGLPRPTVDFTYSVGATASLTSRQLTFGSSRSSVRIGGTLTCTTAGTAQITGTVKQSGSTAQGSFKVSVPCGPSPVTWSATARTTSTKLFTAGTATVSLSLSVTPQDLLTFARTKTGSATVTLQLPTVDLPRR